jgi:hypothetical protein
MGAKRKLVPTRVFSDQELETVARELVEHAPGLAGGDFKKELGADYKKEEKRILQAANLLAARRELYRHGSARKVRFFLRDPFDDLARSVAKALADGPLRESDLKYRVETTHRGFGDLLKPWMKGALARNELFPHRPARGSTVKRFGTSPDMGLLLKKVVAELKKVQATPAGRLLSQQQLFEGLATELGLPRPQANAPLSAGRAQFLAKLGELSDGAKPGSLLSIRELRSALPFDKQEFDRLALDLARDGLVTLHQHDFPDSLSDTERAELIADARGTHFVGIALRRPK